MKGFVLKDGNLERYIEQARSVGAALTEEQHQELECREQEVFTEIFDISANAALAGGLLRSTRTPVYKNRFI